MKYFRIFGAAVLAVGASVTACAQSGFGGKYANNIAPYVPSPQVIVNRMLEIADLKPGETIYDLGSGDGRILITAAQRYRAKAVGIEISPELVKSANERIAKSGVQNLAKTLQGDLLQVDLSPADVVTIYLMTTSNEILRPRLEKFMKPGSRVVSHEYQVPGWKADYVERPEGFEKGHVIYLYKMPPRK